MNERGRIVISGASGFVGRPLTRMLRDAGWEVVPLVRREAAANEISWDPAAGRIDRHALDGVDAVVHLAGESVAGVWTEAKKRRILESRARGTRVLATAVAALRTPPRTFVSASGVNYYGSAGDSVLTEADPPGSDFMARVCVEWESATTPASDAGIRVVRSRFGVMLDRSGGALAAMLPAFRLGVGARLGDGKHWMSWITLEDALRAVLFALDTPALDGAMNTTAPFPVRNEEYTRQLAAHLGRPAFLRVPKFALALAPGGMGEDFLLGSQRVVPQRLLEQGFGFRHPNLADALAAVLGPGADASAARST